MTTRFRIWFLLASLCITTICGGSATIAVGASVPVLVKDINTRIKDNSNIKNMVAVGNGLYFTAYDRAHGNELWKSDGTSTAMVKDIRPGPGDSVWSGGNYLTYWNGLVYFNVDGPNGYSLWKSDGTAANTVQVSSDVDPLHRVDPVNIVVFKNILYFCGWGDGLWKSDGTTAGTVAVKKGLGTFGELIVAGTDRLYFTYNNNLYTSDGTTSGTILLKSGVEPAQLTSVNGILYFYGWDSVANDYRLWTSNGTPSGTSALSYAAIPDKLTDVNGTLYFSADDPGQGWSLMKLAAGATTPTVVKNGLSSIDYPKNINGTLYFNQANGLWKSDGTFAGTVEVKSGVWPTRITLANNIIYFRGDDDSGHGYELWRSDGTSGGTFMVKDIYPGATGSEPDQLTNVNGTLFFTATDPTTGTQLWKSDGTATGTVLVQNVSPGTQDANPGNFVDVNGTLYFAADNYTNDVKLWQSNGMAAATSMVPGFDGTSPVPLINGNGTLYFCGSGTDLWMRVGTNAAVKVKADVYPDDPSKVAYINDILYFRGFDDAHGYELWKSNGTDTGTVMVKDINPGTPNVTIADLTNLNNTLYFIADDGTNGPQLWKSNGIDTGTVLVRSDITKVSNLRLVNGKLFFTGDDASNTDALWVSDGSSGGTTVLRSGIYPVKLTAVGSTLFFQAWTTASGHELWKSNGTVAGTVLVKDVNPGTGDGYPENLTNVNGTLYFSVWNTWGTTAHDQLWKSDGTSAGTILVKDLPPDYGYTSIDLLTSVHGILAFVFRDKSYAQGYDLSSELWISDGTAAGTVMVKDIYPGNYGSAPADLTMANTPPNGIDKQALFFSAIDPIYGNELFILDFTPPVSAISSPANNAFLRGTSLSISGTAIDSMPGTGVNFVDVSVDNGTTWRRTTDTSGNGTWATWQYTWTPLPVDGVYTIKNRATDVATNVQTPLDSISITIDNTPPASVITQPLYYRGAPPRLITGTASDNLSGVSKVEVSTDNGVSWQNATVTSLNSTSTTWQYSWTPSLVDGSYPIKSRATDRSGNIQSPVASGTAIIDNVAPTSNITVPANGAYFHVTSTQISVAAGDDRSGVALVEVSINNGIWQSATYNSGAGTWQVTGTLPAANGQYTIRSRSTDRAGNVQNPPSSIIINIDNTPRTLFIDLAGTGGGTVKFVEQSLICGADCLTTVYAGDPVTLQAKVNQYSLFSGWSNACGGSGDCVFTVPGAATVTATATFTTDSAHAVLVSPNYYSTILGAYQASATTSGSILRIWGILFPETLLFDQGKLVILRGGDNGAHSSNSGGMTTVQGPMTIKSGGITVENVTIR